MSTSMYTASAPVFARALTQLRHVLGKGAAHATARKIDESVFVNGRLAPDMFPLSKQVQIATDHARGTVARLAGHEPPSWEDNEKTFADLIARVDRAIAAVEAAKPSDIDGSESRPVTRKIRGEPKTFRGQAYLFTYALPNFWFHAAMTYAILRHLGVDVGKNDWIGPLD
ncbi:MAG: DUF1993 domain-containing protein [Burkholderiales bacterium]